MSPTAVDYLVSGCRAYCCFKTEIMDWYKKT